MPTIDPRSILLMASFVSVFCLIVLWIMYRSYPPSIRGLKEWVWACAMAIAAASLVSARGYISPVFSVVLGNVLIAAYLLMTYQGIRCFSGHHVRYRTVALILLLLAALWVWAWLSGDYARYAILLSGLSNSVLLACCTVGAWKIQQRSAAKWFTVGSFAVVTFVVAFRLLTAAIKVDVPVDVFDPSLIHKIYLASFSMLSLATSFGFMLLAGNKLREELVVINKSLEEAVAERTVDLQRQVVRAKSLEREVANVAESERRRIGRELHDDLGQQLTGISLSAEALAELMKKDSPSVRGLAHAMGQASSEAIVKLRRIANGLMPVSPGEDGLREALNRLAVNVATLSKVNCVFDYDDPVDVADENVAINLFRIAQEAVNNAVKHARATHVLLRLDEVDGKTLLSVSDNGVGLPPQKTNRADFGKGMGLKIMEFRASVIDFSLTIESSMGQGTTIKVMQC